jgi:hypothetical protein
MSRILFLWLETLVLLFTFSITIYQYTVETPSTHGNDHKALYSKHILATFIVLYIVLDGRAIRWGTFLVFTVVLAFDVLFFVEVVLFMPQSCYPCYVLELVAGTAHMTLSVCYVFWCVGKLIK